MFFSLQAKPIKWLRSQQKVQRFVNCLKIRPQEWLLRTVKTLGSSLREPNRGRPQVRPRRPLPSSRGHQFNQLLLRNIHPSPVQ